LEAGIDFRTSRYFQNTIDTISYVHNLARTVPGTVPTLLAPNRGLPLNLLEALILASELGGVVGPQLLDIMMDSESSCRQIFLQRVQELSLRDKAIESARTRLRWIRVSS
jgi:hypothetical protein